MFNPDKNLFLDEHDGGRISMGCNACDDNTVTTFGFCPAVVDVVKAFAEHTAWHAQQATPDDNVFHADFTAKSKSADNSAVDELIEDLKEEVMAIVSVYAPRAQKVLTELGLKNFLK